MAAQFSKRLFWFIVGINFFNYMDRYTLPAVLEPLGRDLTLTDSERGLLGSAFLLSYMLASPLFGIFGDRFSRPKIISLAILLWSLSTMATMWASSFASLVVLRSLVGVGEAAYYGLGVAMLCDIIPEKERNGKLTFFFLAIPLGSAIGFGVSGMIAQHLGWRMSFLLSGFPGLLLALGMWFVRDPVRGANDLIADSTASLHFGERMKFLFTHRIWLVCTLSYIFYTFGMGALTHWNASFLERVHGVSTGSAGLIVGGMAAITGICGTMLGGYVVQKFQNSHPHLDVWLALVTLSLGGLGVAGYLLAPSLPVAYLALFLGMMSLFINTTPVNNLTVSHLPASIRAWGASVNVLLIHAFGDALSPSLVGAMSDASGATGGALRFALLITVPAFILSGAVLVFAKRARNT